MESTWPASFAAMMEETSGILENFTSRGPCRENSTRSLARSANPELQGSRWYLRKACDSQSTVTPQSLAQAVVLEDCRSTVVNIPEKAAAVVMDNCQRTTVQVHGVVSNVEMIRCSNCILQIHGTLPMVVLDECEGITVELRDQEACSVTITSSKCSEINVSVPKDFEGSSQDDFIELPIPVQFRTTLDRSTNRLITEAVQHIGV